MRRRFDSVRNSLAHKLPPRARLHIYSGALHILGVVDARAMLRIELADGRLKPMARPLFFLNPPAIFWRDFHQSLQPIPNLVDPRDFGHTQPPAVFQ